MGVKAKTILRSKDVKATARHDYQIPTVTTSRHTRDGRAGNFDLATLFDGSELQGGLIGDMAEARDRGRTAISSASDGPRGTLATIENGDILTHSATSNCSPHHRV